MASEKETARLKVMLKPTVVGSEKGHQAMAVPHHLPPITTTPAVGPGPGPGPGLGPALSPDLGPSLAPASGAPAPGLLPSGMMMRQGSIMESLGIFGGGGGATAGPSQKSTGRLVGTARPQGTAKPPGATSPEGDTLGSGNVQGSGKISFNLSESPSLSSPPPGLGTTARQSSLARGMSQAFLGLRKPRKESITISSKNFIFRPTIWMDGEVKRYADQVCPVKFPVKFPSQMPSQILI